MCAVNDTVNGIRGNFYIASVRYDRDERGDRTIVTLRKPCLQANFGVYRQPTLNVGDVIDPPTTTSNANNTQVVEMIANLRAQVLQWAGRMVKMATLSSFSSKWGLGFVATCHPDETLGQQTAQQPVRFFSGRAFECAQNRGHAGSSAGPKGGI